MNNVAENIMRFHTLKEKNQLADPVFKLPEIAHNVIMILDEEEIRKELNEGEHSQVFSVILGRDTEKFSTAYRLTYGTTLIILSLAAQISQVPHETARVHLR